jgi:hypothetical protein
LKKAVAETVLLKQPVVEKTAVAPVEYRSGGPEPNDKATVELAATCTHSTGVTAPSAGADVALKVIRKPADAPAVT